MDPKSSGWRDAVPGLAILIAVWIDAGIQEAYFRLGTEVPKMVGLALLTGTLLLLGALSSRPRSESRCWGLLWRVVTALLLAAAVLVHSSTATWFVSLGAAATSCWIAALAATAGVLFIQAPPAVWQRLRPALAVAAVLFASSVPLLALLMRQPVIWRPAQPPAVPGVPGDVTLFVLLDELNWKSAGVIVEALRLEGLDVHAKALSPVGDATVKVVPQMFSGKPFPAAAPCLPSALCSGRDVMDFSEVRIRRSDVDIVGFYHPYCAMRGWRFCYVRRPSSAAFDPSRWRCALERRMPALFGASRLSKPCAVQGANVAADQVGGLFDALQQAPVWTRGGVLFAHLPLPHPPGVVANGTLSEQYDDNLRRAASWLRERIALLRTNGFIRPTVIVFSDHPLRQTVWCGISTFSHNGCPLPPDHIDTQVPLIVTGKGMMPAFARITTNADVFKLLPSY